LIEGPADMNGRMDELLLEHDHHGVDLKLDWAQEVLVALNRVWKRPVEIFTTVEDKASRLRFDGTEHLRRTR